MVSCPRERDELVDRVPCDAKRNPRDVGPDQHHRRCPVERVVVERTRGVVDADPEGTPIGHDQILSRHVVRVGAAHAERVPRPDDRGFVSREERGPHQRSAVDHIGFSVVHGQRRDPDPARIRDVGGEGSLPRQSQPAVDPLALEGNRERHGDDLVGASPYISSAVSLGSREHHHAEEDVACSIHAAALS